jgi:hypothetical protein
MRILRCQICEKPCTLTTLDDDEIKFCPVDKETAEWKQVNKKAPA